MNKGHPNIEILKRFDPADPNTAAEMLAEDFAWHCGLYLSGVGGPTAGFSFWKKQEDGYTS